MTASYPNSIASFPTRLDNEVIDNTHMNSVQEEIVALESTLGTGLLAKATGPYDGVSSSFSTLSSRVSNIERGVASTDVSVHPQYLPKSGGTILPTSGDVTSLVVRQSPDATGDVFQVRSATDEYFSVHHDKTTNAYGKVIVGKGIDSTTDADLARNLLLSSGSTYSGLVLESRRGTSTTAGLTAAGSLVLAGDLTVGGTLTVSSLAGFAHTHENASEGGRVLPAGMLMPWAGTGVAPDGWLECNGQTVLRSSFPDLFIAIGETYGAGNGSTTFQVPNLKGRVAVGVDASQEEFSVLGKAGGSKTSVAAHTHANTHSHSGTTGGMSENATHAHQYFDSQAQTGTPASYGTAEVGNSTRTTLSTSTEHTHAFTTTASSGDTAPTGLASGNLQPFISLRYMMKT